MSHACFWPGCKRRVPDNHLGCLPHWFALPYPLQRNVLSAYKLRPGSAAHLEAIAACVEYAQKKEAKCQTPSKPTP